MDEIDLAQARQQLINERALSAHLDKQTRAASRTSCIDCADPIPEPRRQAAPGCTRCIDCQQLHDEETRNYAK